MRNEIISTLSPKYFPTSQFANNTSNPSFLELKEHLESIKRNIVDILPSHKYKVTVNTGVGKLASCPWIGIHSIEDHFDASSQRGLYLTIIWDYDGSGVCLSFQKGTDASSTTEINETVERVRKKYGALNFDKEIDLKAPKTAIRPKTYEKSNIYGKKYAVSD